MAKKQSKQVQKHFLLVLQNHQRMLQDYRQLPWRQRHRQIWNGVGTAALLAIFVGVGLCIFATQYSLVRLSVAGVPVKSSDTSASLEKRLDAQVAGYKVAVQSPDGSSKSYTLTEVGVCPKVSDSASQALMIKKPANIVKRLAFWHRQNLPISLATDDTVMQNFVQTHATQTIAAAKNATIVVDKGVVTVVPEQAGNGYTFNQGTQGLTLAIGKLQTTPLVLQKQSLNPAVNQQAAAPIADKIKKLLAQKVSFTINNKLITPGPADIGGWLDIAPSEAQHTIDFSVNSGKVLSYMNAIAKPYVHPPTTQIVMPDGTELIPGQNGVDITNKEATAADVAQKVMSGQTVAVDLPVRFAGFKTLTATPHDKWIVVDTSTKRMYAYAQTDLIKTFLISAGAPKTPTVTGEYHIYSKFAVQDMRGANADGSRYFQPHVRWINYFYSDYAIHGNYWRPTSYFGNINSSHGCVGVVESDAKWVYDWAPVGTTVIVHS